MRFYNSLGPNPRALRMFLAEKNLKLDTVDVDLMAAENRRPPYTDKNPGGQRPALELEDGRVLGETVAIFEYLEEKNPEPPLIGKTPEERAETRMWQRRIELRITENLYNGFRFAEGLELFKDRMHCLPEAASGLKTIATKLINLLGLHRGETDETPDQESVQGLVDRLVFERTLAVGERSALFESGSHIQKDYGPHHRICYFYVRLPEEVGRVELPAWVAEQPGWLDMIHAVVVDQAEKGGGYPIVLTEAHERAVIRAQEKALFYRILEREMQRAGLRGYAGSQKAASKRAPRI